MSNESALGEITFPVGGGMHNGIFFHNLKFPLKKPPL